MASLFGAQTASAVDFNVRIINLSNGIYYTPFLVAAHPAGTSMFTDRPAGVGQPAGDGGRRRYHWDSSLTSTGLGATIAENPGRWFAGTGIAETNVDLNTDGTSNELLTVVSMLLPTNDAFAGLNAVQIPTEPGTYVFDVPAYDAGTEANDELLTGGGAPGAAGMPADPGGLTGTGGTGAATADDNPNVHIHRGSLGDLDAMGGVSDLDSTVHRWLNPRHPRCRHGSLEERRHEISSKQSGKQVLLVGSRSLRVSPPAITTMTTDSSPTPPRTVPPPPPPAMASFDVTVTNLTNAQPLSPVAVIAHQLTVTRCSRSGHAGNGRPGERSPKVVTTRMLISEADGDANVLATGSGACTDRTG